MADSDAKIKILSDNRKARFDYHLLDRFEAGMSLLGTEVKAARDGKVQLRDGYAEIVEGQVWLVNAHISQYSHATHATHEPERRRKLLLHRREIDKLARKTREKGLTLIPTKVYLKNAKIKCEIALARGKRQYDKREAIKKRETDAEARAAMRRKLK